MVKFEYQMGCGDHRHSLVCCQTEGAPFGQVLWGVLVGLLWVSLVMVYALSGIWVVVNYRGIQNRKLSCRVLRIVVIHCSRIYL